jgi:hypothetical protein
VQKNVAIAMLHMAQAWRLKQGTSQRSCPHLVEAPEALIAVRLPEHIRHAAVFHRPATYTLRL